MCCYALLQGIFPTYRSNPGLPYCRWIPYCLSHQGSPIILEWVSDPFSRGSSWSRNQTGVSCIAGRFFTSWATRWLSHQMMVPTPSPAPRMGLWHTSDLIRALYSPDHHDSFWDQVTSEVIPLNSLSLEPTNSIFVLAAPGRVSVTCNHKRTGDSSIGAECLWGCPRVKLAARMQKPHTWPQVCEQLLWPRCLCREAASGSQDRVGCVATGCVHSQSDPPTLSRAASPQASALAPLQSGWNMGLPFGSVVKNLPANVGDTDSISGSGRSPGKGNGNPLQYSCLGNPMGRGAWCATVHSITKSQTRLSNWAWNACLVMIVVKYCVAYFTVVKRVDLKSSHHKKTKCSESLYSGGC